MTDYRKMSDFEINLLITKIIHGEIVSYSSNKETPDNMDHWPQVLSIGDDIYIKHMHEPEDEYPYSDFCFCNFNPCNNPSDAWPIIVENGISLYHDNGNWQAEMTYDAPIGAFGTDEKCSKFVDDKNPLRAAMIVFLMMKEAAENV